MPFIENLGQKIHFEVTGDGPPVVLGHGFLFSGGMWRHQVPVLAERFRVVAVDFRGHGRSGRVSRGFHLFDLVDDVLAVLDELGIQRAAWCGLSMGGMVALRAAVEYPERVARLALLDTDAGAESSILRLKYDLLSRVSAWTEIGPLLPLVTPILFGRTSRKRGLPAIAEWQAAMRQADLPSLRYAIRAVARRASLLSALPAVAVPALVVVGEEDRALPPDRSVRLHEGLGNSRLVRIPEAGHMSALEAPEAVTEALLAFLSGGETW